MTRHGLGVAKVKLQKKTKKGRGRGGLTLISLLGIRKKRPNKKRRKKGKWRTIFCGVFLVCFGGVCC